MNHAFAAAIAPYDRYDDQRIRDAVRRLGQDPDRDLSCAYCGSPAETWDHVYATDRDKKFSGFGHRLGNLLPCCKPRNFRKGNKELTTHLGTLGLNPGQFALRKRLIESYLAEYRVVESLPEHLPEYQQLQDLQQHVFDTLARADALADQLRLKVGAA